MERAHQMISGDGLQIPLPLMQRYGLQPGAQVVLELGAEGIRVLPALAHRQKIESQALRHLLRHLGDAVTIEARQREGAWRVIVFASGSLRPIGELIYDLAGDFLDKYRTQTLAPHCVWCTLALPLRCASGKGCRCKRRLRTQIKSKKNL